MSRTRWIAAFAFSLVLAFALDAFAQTRTETLRWTQADTSEVTGYRIHYGPASRQYTASVDAGIPPIVSGAFEYQVQVDAIADVYFAVTAYNEDAESYYSNERCRAQAGDCAQEPPASTPGDDATPSSGEETAQAGVVGFALWDAQSDSVIDEDFQSGDQISTATYTCTAIEILGNSYLTTSGPGSVAYVFDGQDPGGCNDPGRSHENNPPFAWEEDTGPGSFECAETLTKPGRHTLVVTPFDGDDCTGLQGEPVTLDFEVLDASGSTVPAALGRPGRPTLVLE